MRGIDRNPTGKISQARFDESQETEATNLVKWVPDGNPQFLRIPPLTPIKPFNPQLMVTSSTSTDIDAESSLPTAAEPTIGAAKHPRQHPRVRVAGYDSHKGTFPAKQEDVFWADVHPRIASRIRALFEAGNFAGVVEEAFQTVHAIVQREVQVRSGIELEGRILMSRAFSPESPIIQLENTSTAGGKATQRGFMQLFVGSFAGWGQDVRKAPEKITARQARHAAHLASLLLEILDRHVLPKSNRAMV